MAALLTSRNIGNPLPCPLPRSAAHCRLEEAYAAAVAAQGGLSAARPRQLLHTLLPEFPELTLEVRTQQPPVHIEQHHRA